MATSTQQQLAQTIGITTSLIAAGGILSISALINPLLDSSARSTSSTKPNPSSSLPAIRFIFSRGSHLFPQAATFAASCFGYLAYCTERSSSVVSFGEKVLGVAVQKRTGWIAAAVLTASIMPFTALVMLPAANQRLRELAELEEKGRGGEVDVEELRVVVRRFGLLNYVRGVLMMAGGVVGLVNALP